MAIHAFYSERKTIDIGTLLLESGTELPGVSLIYERVGPWDAPVVLICHALTGNHKTIGNEKTPGWWNGLVGRKQFIDTEKYQVITFNVLGGCDGSTGPLSINPLTNKPYQLDFPTLSIRDIVRAQYEALNHLNIREVHAIIGGSLGGMQVLEWGLLYPSFMKKLIALAVTPTLSDFGIAFNYIAEQAIKADPEWQNGYYQDYSDFKGLEIARMIGMVTYRSAQLFSERFSRQKSDEVFSVTSYLKYQGKKLVQRFDANSYLYLLDAMNTHDIGRNRGNWMIASQMYECRVLFIGYENDLIYDPSTIKEFSEMVPYAVYHHVQTNYGHDGFLTEYGKWGSVVSDFLENNNR
ncbi:homoserine O-acetyltransferase MetX [Ornithinibacillus scapharcae]|uniref:homoserine O-acetyltransferase MetX n=1 Tax=Ornithinibacillus scapharcae TaxID=1147159 RepID=UPI000225AE46|nr:homoserine O-acetyltransferase [Ornithinibacillus scapharcae]